MKEKLQIEKAELQEKDRISGYIIRKKVGLPRIKARLLMLEHEATGAEHLHIATEDDENTFGVAFKTVPQDSTGVAHILEHTVLCGSERFPVRDPFFSMLKRSLNTFMNAFTAPDFTVYPFSTQNQKDFYNLMDVYLDAVFFPKLDELSFKQEGHRLEIEESKESDSGYALSYKGVVYNEMKGAMSSPDQVMIRSLQQALFPTGTYHYNSGGDPLNIPDLTYEQLKTFHKIHYHPSNAYFYTYGNFPLEAHLAFIQTRILNRFHRTHPDTEVFPQPRWADPKAAAFYYPVERQENVSKKSQAAVVWLTADVKNSFNVLVLTLLEQILLGNAASPVRKALMDSGLGTALSDGTGFASEYRDTFFACGLKGVDLSDAEPIEAIVLETLENLSKNGLDPDLIESAVHQLEFHRKEITNHPYPYGIKLLMSFCGSWLHGGDPGETLLFEKDLQRIKEELAASPFFENQIRHFFLDNPHRLLLTLSPDPFMEERESNAISAKLEALKAELTSRHVERIKNETRQLLLLQEKTEDISVLPTLEVTDIPPDIRRIGPSEENAGMFLSRYHQPTGGIFYFSSIAGIRELNDKDLSLIPFLCYAFSRIGTTRRSYAEMAKWMDRYAGGIGFNSHAGTCFDEKGSVYPYISFGSKCLDVNCEKLFEIMEELIFQSDFSDLTRIKTLLLEYKASLESMVVHNGHRLAISLASRYFSPAAFLNETWHGISQLRVIKELAANLDSNKIASLAGDLNRIARQIFKDGNLQAAIVGEKESLDRSIQLLSDTSGIPGLIQRSTSASSPQIPSGDFHPKTIKEGWSTSTAV
ncbi:MAG: insulinase family protein, partial [Thermodesulfobacteriota bacterium]